MNVDCDAKMERDQGDDNGYLYLPAAHEEIMPHLPRSRVMGLERNDATIRESDRGYCRLDATFLPSQIS